MELSSGHTGTAGLDVDGLRRLFDDEYEALFRLALAMLGSAGDAEDVVQDGFVTVSRRWTGLDNPGGYLRTTVVNGARRRLRTRTRQAMAEASVASNLGAQSAEAPDLLLDVVDGLPERQRTAVVLRFYGGWTASEIGEVLECPAGTVRSLLHRALAAMRGEVEQ